MLGQLVDSSWEILGFTEATYNIGDIKKAYAARLKANRPEDDPAFFIELRDAYEKALNYASTHSDFLTPNNEVVSPSGLSISSSDNFEKKERNEVDLLAWVKPEIQELLSDSTLRNSYEKWHGLIQDPRLETINDSMFFSSSLREVLLERLGFYEINDMHDVTKSDLFTEDVSDLLYEYVVLDNDIHNFEQEEENEWLGLVLGKNDGVAQEDRRGLFWGRLILSVVFLIIGSACILGGIQSNSIFYIVLGTILIFRFIRVWIIMIKDEWF